MAKKRFVKEAACVGHAIVSSVVLGFALVTLAGCSPYVISYVYLDSPGVTYKRSPCRDGAPVGVGYERLGVRFEVSLDPHALSRLNEPYLKLHAPRDSVVSIPDPIAQITFRGEGKNKPMYVQIKSAPLDWQGPYVEDMRRRSPLAEHRFVFVDLPPIDSPGNLQLPPVSVNGTLVESPAFTFERRAYAGVVPLNC